jgi:hypothetical protein
MHTYFSLDGNLDESRGILNVPLGKVEYALAAMLVRNTSTKEEEELEGLWESTINVLSEDGFWGHWDALISPFANAHSLPIRCLREDAMLAAFSEGLVAPHVTTTLFRRWQQMLADRSKVEALSAKAGEVFYALAGTWEGSVDDLIAASRDTVDDNLAS